MRMGLALVALALAFPAQAQRAEQPIIGVKRTVEALAFYPSHFFEWGWADKVRIRYRGDDWGWPVYSIAVQNGCEDEKAPRPACTDRRIARMARAPIGPQGTGRPRWRGSDLVARIFKSGARGDRAIKAQLDRAGIEWLEADLQSCPGAMDMLARAETLRWGPYERPPNPDGSIVVSMHSDSVEVGFEVPDGRVTWRGLGPEGTPARWANDFATVLEPCWKPATAPTPWRRVPAAD